MFLWATSCHCVHLQIISEHYKRINAVWEHDQKVEFENDSIKLDIPFPSLEGITTDNKAWRIIAQTPPVVCYIQKVIV